MRECEVYESHGDAADAALPANGGAKTERINLGLDLLAMRTPPGVELTQTEIAAWCGCRSEYIRQIEERGLRKIRRKLMSNPELAEAWREVIGIKSRKGMEAV